MATAFDLGKMSIADKLRLMEDLWADLSTENLVSPAWHDEVLTERERLTASGEEKFVDWETARQQLRQELNDDRPLVPIEPNSQNRYPKALGPT